MPRLLWIIALLGASLAAQTDDIRRGREAIRRQQYRQAVRILEPAVAADPRTPAPSIYLGYAYAGMHRCDEALALLRPLADKPAFTPEAARMTASCAAQLGLASEAVYWAELATLLAPERPAFGVSLAIYRIWAGDERQGLALLDALEAEAPEDLEVRVSRAMVLLSLGDAEGVAAILEALPAARRQRPPMAHFLEGRLALDQGEPDRAVNAFARAFWRQQSYLPSVAWWGEAVRRQGFPDEAAHLLEYTGDTLYPREIRHLFTRQIEARVAVDRGDLDRARALVDASLAADPLDPEAVASAWYLARARGDDASSAALAERYATLELSQLRALDQLTPLRAY